MMCTWTKRGSIWGGGGKRLLTISWHKSRPKKPVNEIQNHLLWDEGGIKLLSYCISWIGRKHKAGECQVPERIQRCQAVHVAVGSGQGACSPAPGMTCPEISIPRSLWETLPECPWQNPGWVLGGWDPSLGGGRIRSALVSMIAVVVRLSACLATGALVTRVRVCRRVSRMGWAVSPRTQEGASFALLGAWTGRMAEGRGSLPARSWAGRAPLAPGVGLGRGCTDSSRGVCNFQTAASIITRAVLCNKPHIHAYISHLTGSVSLETLIQWSVMGERGITLQSVEKGK